MSGRQYTLRVFSLQPETFDGTYALAWNVSSSTTPAPLPPAFVLLLGGLATLVPVLGRGHSRRNA